MEAEVSVRGWRAGGRVASRRPHGERARARRVETFSVATASKSETRPTAEVGAAPLAHVMRKKPQSSRGWSYTKLFR